MMRPAKDLPLVYLCRDVVDFRKSINTLSVLVEETLSLDPFSEHSLACWPISLCLNTRMLYLCTGKRPSCNAWCRATSCNTCELDD